MSERLRRAAVVALVPTAADIGLLVLLRQGAGWILVVADLTAIAVASVLSYGLHRRISFRSDPFVRWVRMPAAFVAVAILAALVDVAVLRGLFAAQEFSATSTLLGAKVVALGAAAVVRVVLYRALLLDAVRRTLQERVERPLAPGPLRATVVVPALDEAVGIGATIAAIRAALRPLALDGGVEIVVVDDGSSDGTADAALAGGADQVVSLPVNRGKGAAVRAGVEAARGRSIAFTDADLAYSPDQLLGIIAEVEAGWDLAIGSRRHPSTERVQGAGVLRDLGSRGINLLAMGVLLSHPHDTQCGLKAFRSDVGKTVFALGRVDGFAFDVEVLHMVERHGFSVTEVPVRLSMGERSTVRLVRDTFRMLRDLWRIRHWSATGAYELPAQAEVTSPVG
ncbi:MAG: glycosyltransferase [Acidimicrobiales bacterium]